MKLKTVMALVIAAAFAAPVLAQSPGRTTTDPKDSNPAAPPAAAGKADRPAAGATAGGFAAMDRNSDGYISRDEARDATWNTRFSELDKDNDGRISQSEFSALSGNAAGAAGATVDKDARSPSTTGGMGGSVGPGGTQSGSSTSGTGDKPGQKQ